MVYVKYALLNIILNIKARLAELHEAIKAVGNKDLRVGNKVRFPALDGIVTKLTVLLIFYVYFRHNSPQGARASSFTRFLDHTQRRNTVSRTPPDE